MRSSADTSGRYEMPHLEPKMLALLTAEHAEVFGMKRIMCDKAFRFVSRKMKLPDRGRDIVVFTEVELACRAKYTGNVVG